MSERQIKGILGTKLGMTQVFDDQNHVVPVTVVQAGPCVVTQIKTPEKDGYAAVQLACGAVDPRRVAKPRAGHFEKAGVTPRRHVVELRTGDASQYEVGQEITSELFDSGAVIDVVGTSKGKGFTGTIKRHGFGGQGASHGNHKAHRIPGSIGGCAYPGRVFKGMKMAGHMGNRRVTTQKLKLHDVQNESGYLLVRGAVPGPRGGLVMVKSTVKGGAVQ